MNIIGRIQKWWFRGYGKKFTKEQIWASQMTVKELLDEINLIKTKSSKLSHKKRMAILERYNSVSRRKYMYGK